MTLSAPSFSAAAARSSIVPKSLSEVAFADFSLTVTALPDDDADEEEEDPPAAMDRASTAAMGMAIALRREIICASLS